MGLELLGPVFGILSILWFLGEGTAFLPSDGLQRAQVVQWLVFEQEYVTSGIEDVRVHILTGRGPDLIRSRRDKVTTRRPHKD